MTNFFECHFELSPTLFIWGRFTNNGTFSLQSNATETGSFILNGNYSGSGNFGNRCYMTGGGSNWMLMVLGLTSQNRWLAILQQQELVMAMIFMDGANRMECG